MHMLAVEKKPLAREKGKEAIDSLTGEARIASELPVLHLSSAVLL